jgi:hypothetical protein
VKPKCNFRLSQLATTTKKNLKKLFFILFLFFPALHGRSPAEGREEEGRERGEGRGGRESEREGDASARTPMSARTLSCVRADMGVRSDASASAQTHLILPQVTSKKTLQCVQVTDAPMAIVRSSVRPSVCSKTSA